MANITELQKVKRKKSFHNTSKNNLLDERTYVIKNTPCFMLLKNKLVKC